MLRQVKKNDKPLLFEPSDPVSVIYYAMTGSPVCLCYIRSHSVGYNIPSKWSAVQKDLVEVKRKRRKKENLYTKQKTHR